MTVKTPRTGTRPPCIHEGFRVAAVASLAVLLGVLAYGRVDLGFMTFGKRAENLLWVPGLLAVATLWHAPRERRRGLPLAACLAAGAALVVAAVRLVVLLFNTDDPGKIGSDIASQFLPTLFVFFPLVAYLVAKRPATDRSFPTAAGVILYVVLITLSISWAYDPEEGLEAIHEAWPAVVVVVLFLAVTRSTRDVKLLMGLFLAGATAVALRGIVTWRVRPDAVVAATWVQKNTFGDFLLMPLGLSMGLLWHHSRRSSLTALYALLAIVFGFVLVITQSRGALAGAVVAFVVVGFLRGPRRFAVLAVAGAALLLAVVNRDPASVVSIPVVEHMLTFATRSDPNTQERMKFFWPVALDMFRAHPVGGLGPGSHRPYAAAASLGHYRVRLVPQGGVTGALSGRLTKRDDGFRVAVTRGTLTVQPEAIASLTATTLVLRNGSRLEHCAFATRPAEDGRGLRAHFYLVGGTYEGPSAALGRTRAARFAHAHNEFLQSLVSLGALGGFFCAGFWLTALWVSWHNLQRYRHGLYGAIAFGSAFWLAAHFTHGLVEHFYGRSRYNMAVAFFWALAIWLYHRRTTAPPPPPRSAQTL